MNKHLDRLTFKPQPGPQYAFLNTSADICIYGGGAGGGKSFGLLLEPLRHLENSNFSAVVFRRTLKEIKKPGGLWDQSCNIYPHFKSIPFGQIQWKFPSGMKVEFSHLEYEKDKYSWNGAQVPFIGFDEVQSFSESMFIYMLSRNRSESKVPGYIRATCNPEADSWLLRWISWWIGDDGFAIPERAGIIRWFLRQHDETIWADSKEELEEKYGKDSYPKSFTFIPANIYDNKILLENDPAYLSSLKALNEVEKQRLLYGNWKIKPSAGLYFKRAHFEIVEAAPADVQRIRYWDRAATEESPNNPDPDYTVGAKLSMDRNGIFYFEHIERLRANPDNVQRVIKNLASQDGRTCMIGLEGEPGASGKFEAQFVARLLAGFHVKIFPAVKDKITRALPLASQVQAGNVKMVRGDWNDAFFVEAENFPPETTGHDDQVDACSGAFNALVQCKQPDLYIPADDDLNKTNEWDI